MGGETDVIVHAVQLNRVRADLTGHTLVMRIALPAVQRGGVRPLRCSLDSTTTGDPIFVEGHDQQWAGVPR